MVNTFIYELLWTQRKSGRKFYKLASCASKDKSLLKIEPNIPNLPTHTTNWSTFPEVWRWNCNVSQAVEALDVARLSTNFLCLPDCLIFLSRIDQAGRLAWFAWAGLIRLEWFAWFAWAGLIRLGRVPDLPEQDWWSCSGKSGNQANNQNLWKV